MLKEYVDRDSQVNHGIKLVVHLPHSEDLSNGVQSVLMPDFGAGIYVYSTEKKWYAGASVPQIFQEQIKFFNAETSSLSKLATHMYITGGYKFTLNDDFKLEPSTCIKFVNPAPVQFDLGVRAIYKDMIWLGGAYRSMDAVSAMVGYILMQNVTLAYSYDFTTTNIRKYSSGTHEIMIGIRFNKSIKK
jgi:type IX secretion system PorP/SprF family membrane protein